MVVFVNPEFYLSAYDRIRQLFRTSKIPIHVFCGVSADTCAASCLLLNLFQTDLIGFEVHPVHTTDDIHNVVRSHDVFREEPIFQCVFLNCGASMPLPSFIETERCHVHVMDSHGPLHLENVLCPSHNLYLWDASCIQKDIERHFARSKGKRGRDDEMSEDDGGTQDFSYEMLANLSQEEERRYYSMPFHGVSPSKVLFDISMSLRTSTDDEMLWYRAVALTDNHLQNLGSSETYAADMFKIQDAVNVAGLAKSRVRKIALRDIEANTEESITVGSYHRVQVENIEDHRLMLLHHWTLWEAVHHSPYMAHRLQLMRNDSVGSENLKDLLAQIGVTVREAQTRWTELPGSRRQEILGLLSSYGKKLYNIQRLEYHSIAKRHGYSYWCSATDMVRLVHYGLVNAESSDIRSAFLRNVAALSNRNVCTLQSSMALCTEYTKSVFQQACALLQKNLITSLRSFHYVFLADDDVPQHYLHPIALRGLAAYLLPSLMKDGKPRPLVVGALDATKSTYVLVGCSAASTKTTMVTHFAKAAERYPAIVQHNGIDRDWITVHRDQCVFVLESMHLDIISDRLPYAR